MKCDWCKGGVELQSFEKVLGRLPTTVDFDNDGKVYKICPNCFSVDTISTITERELQRKIVENCNCFSRRDKKIVVQKLVDKQNKKEDRKFLIATLVNTVKSQTDEQCLETLSNFFKLSKEYIQMLFYNVKIYRTYKKV